MPGGSSPFSSPKNILETWSSDSPSGVGAREPACPHAVGARSDLEADASVQHRGFSESHARHLGKWLVWTFLKLRWMLSQKLWRGLSRKEEESGLWSRVMPQNTRRTRRKTPKKSRGIRCKTRFFVTTRSRPVESVGIVVRILICHVFSAFLAGRCMEK